MEKNNKHIKDILKQATTHRPADDMASRVLDAWKAEQVPLTKVAPLISRRTWALIALSILGFIYWVVASYSSVAPQTKLGEYIAKLDFSFNASMLNWSPILTMSLAAFALMIGLNILIYKSKSNARAYFN